VQIDPIKPTLKAPGTERLKLKYDKPLSNVALKFINLRRFTTVAAARARAAAEAAAAAASLAGPASLAAAVGVRQGLTLVHFSSPT
jgi:hypothetical protein